LSIYNASDILLAVSLDPDAFFSALAHPLRLRTLILLHQEHELCVCELTAALGVSQPMISRHLAQLREARVVRDRREALWVHYSLHPDLPAWARGVLTDAAAGLAGQTPYAHDRAVLAAMPQRPIPKRCA